MNDRNGHERGPAGAIGAILGLITVGLLVTVALAKRRSREGRDIRGFGNGGGAISGAIPPPDAMSNFDMPEDMRAVIPEPPSYAPA